MHLPILCVEQTVSAALIFAVALCHGKIIAGTQKNIEHEKYK
jgi:hypothetical protein